MDRRHARIALERHVNVACRANRIIGLGLLVSTRLITICIEPFYSESVLLGYNIDLLLMGMRMEHTLAVFTAR